LKLDTSGGAVKNDSVLHILSLVLLGSVAGSASGLVGIGGGVVLVPCLIFFLGFSQHQAQGTTLAMMVPPAGILAAWAYWRQGYVDLRAAAFLCAGFVVGALFGARLAVGVSDRMLERAFGLGMLAVGIKMLIGR
jgi:uncharacterized membrane protein YfcA